MGVRPGSEPAHTSSVIGYTTQRDAIRTWPAQLSPGSIALCEQGTQGSLLREDRHSPQARLQLDYQAQLAHSTIGLLTETPTD